MLNAIQLLEKITGDESSAVEFKEVEFKTARVLGNKVKEPDRSDLSDEIAAFANHRGGMLIFGVSDDGEILGTGGGSAALIHFISEICQDTIEPPVADYFVDSVRAPDAEGEEKTLVYIEIGRSLWPHQSAGGYFLRQGDAKRKMTTEQLGRILQARSQARIISFDEQCVPRADQSILREDLYTRFLRPADTGQGAREQLLKRRLLVDNNGSYQVSVAGMLMCSDRADEYLYNCYICAVCYRGTHKDANYQLDAQDFKGPLDRQILDAYKFVDKHNQKSARKEAGREERPQYSMKAVFEALVNAVAHRDYSIHGSKIRLFMFQDRLELCSPGALANTITVDTLEDNQATRNELLCRLLSELPVTEPVNDAATRTWFLERRGEGVGIILRESERLSGKRPRYEMLGEELCLTIYAAQSMQEGVA